jgi:hypothetical protein
LPPPPRNLPMIALLKPRYPNPPEHPLGQKVSQLPAVSTVRLDPIPILLRQQARWSNNTVRSIGHQSIMKPKPKIARLIHHLMESPRYRSNNRRKASHCPGKVPLKSS